MYSCTGSKFDDAVAIRTKIFINAKTFKNRQIFRKVNVVFEGFMLCFDFLRLLLLAFVGLASVFSLVQVTHLPEFLQTTVHYSLQKGGFEH